MNRQALRDIKQRVADFWNVHRAFTGGDSAEDYITRYQEFIDGPKARTDRDAKSEERMLNAIGATKQ